MLKLPKGLKKKKKGKKSKKDKELFTEEELEEYKRQLQQKQEQQQQENQQANQQQNDPESEFAASSDAEQPQKSASTAEKKEEDEEWSKFKALTAGVDSILHKTQDDLDRIKSTSFFQRVPPPSEKKKQQQEKAAALEVQRVEEERRKKEEEEANRDKLAEAIVELSESEEESEASDDIFDTAYIDAVTSGEIQLTVVPDSPVFEVEDGPDPFDTSYAEKLIKGPEVSKRGKKIVNIGAAVEVLTGRVDSAQAVAASGAKRKPRRGIQNLLLDNFDDEVAVVPEAEVSVTPEPPKTLLDDPADEIPDVPIDLSVSLHLVLQKETKKEGEEEKDNQEKSEETVEKTTVDVVSEFDVLKDDEDDEFAELAIESLTKKEEVIVITQAQPVQFSGEVEGDWAEFEQQEEELQQEDSSKSSKAKPPRPPPARPATGPHILTAEVDIPKAESDEEFDLPEDDPFDTTFVEKVIPQKEDDDDFDFDPRAEENKTTAPVLAPVEKDLLGGSNPDLTEINSTVNLLVEKQKDLLGGSTSDLSNIPQTPILPTQESKDICDDFDPFDTSAVTNIVQPKETELKFLEKELLADSKLKHSLSDPDFDPRAEETLKTEKVHPSKPALPTFEVANSESNFDSARRKSSLSLNLQSKSVVFLVPDKDLLALDNESGKIQKPLTPYYSTEIIPEKEDTEDPFDTSFVPDTKPTKVELNLLEQDLITKPTLKHSLSDPDFDPRAEDEPSTTTASLNNSDLLVAQDQINIKVLTPAQETIVVTEESNLTFDDPFDTSTVAATILPGKTELKLIENELLPAAKPIETAVLDTQTDAQELGLGDKVLTPQIPIVDSEASKEIDPFDTSFAENLRPGKTEIKILETELIEQ